MRELLAQYSCGAAFECPYHRRWRVTWPDPREQVHVIGHDFLGQDLPSVLVGDLLQQLAAPAGYPSAQNPALVLRAPNQAQA